MTPEETLVLVRYVRACCPQQAIDKYTPEAWHDLLGDLDAADCRAAVAAVARRQPFVAPSEIRAEVRAIVEERFAATEIPAPPAGLLDDPPAYIDHLRHTTRQIAGGHAGPRALDAS